MAKTTGAAGIALIKEFEGLRLTAYKPVAAEDWRVVSVNPRYEVSNTGKIRKATTKREKKTHVNPAGYPSVKLSYGLQGKGTHYTVHKLVATAFLDNPGGYPCVNHIDGDKTNNNVSNLEWCSYSHNNKHAYDMGLKTPYQQVISASERKEIGACRDAGMSVREIAKKYSVTESCIYKLYYRGQIKRGCLS